MSNTNEQWLSNGNCELCRRNKYCDKVNKPCKAHQGFIMRQAMQLGARFAAEMLFGTQKKHDSGTDSADEQEG